ncbi:hypothetical protein ES702_01215 [subsurface metagenome]
MCLILRTMNWFKRKIKLWNTYKIMQPPWGGGNQFLIALFKALRKCRVKVYGRFNPDVEVIFLNSWYLNEKDFDLVNMVKMEKNAKVVHRLNGIGQLYGRGSKDDEIAFNINRDLADMTIFQSRWAKEQFGRLGLRPENHTIIYNGVDTDIFNKKGKKYWDGKEKLKLVASTWSSNIKKGFNYYKEFDKILDKSQDFTIDLIGNIPEGWKFKNIRVYSPVNSKKLAKMLKSCHSLLQFAQDDTCSNAVLEAINCGLPIIYLDSGGTKEIAKEYGVEYKDNLLDAVERLKGGYFSIIERIKDNPFKIEYVADKYLNLFSKLLNKNVN